MLSPATRHHLTFTEGSVYDHHRQLVPEVAPENRATAPKADEEGVERDGRICIALGGYVFDSVYISYRIP